MIPGWGMAGVQVFGGSSGICHLCCASYRGRSTQRLSKIRQSARMRLALVVSKKHRRSRSFGWRALVALSPDEFGLISLYGVTVAPRAGKPWRDKPNADGERPCILVMLRVAAVRGVILVSWPTRRGWKVPACPEPGLAPAGRELSVPECRWACSVVAVAGPVRYRVVAGGQQP
jgi:hypothetical protein